MTGQYFELFEHFSTLIAVAVLQRSLIIDYTTKEDNIENLKREVQELKNQLASKDLQLDEIGCHAFRNLG